MSEQHDLLHNIKVAPVCAGTWDEMVGDERCRRCQKCKLWVYDINELSLEQAGGLIGPNAGELYRRSDGRVMTARCARGPGALAYLVVLGVVGLLMGGLCWLGAALRDLGKFYAHAEYSIVVSQLNALNSYSVEPQKAPRKEVRYMNGQIKKVEY